MSLITMSLIGMSPIRMDAHGIFRRRCRRAAGTGARDTPK